MAEEPLRPPNSTFVVRFWQEWSDAGPRWRGRIEHVQSGKNTVFLDFQGMLGFMRRFGVMTRDRGWTEEGRFDNG